jgi:outer membrane protein OmpA-like peptidoglycan-associated protein
VTDFPDLAAPRPLWLMTLADIALLLLGFTVLIQATAAPDQRAIARGLREAFGAEAAPPIPLASSAVAFAPGSAAPADTRALVAWAADAARDPRVAFTVTGATDSTPADSDPPTGSATLLAADRARAVAALIAPLVGSARLRIATDPLPRGRTATATLAFIGERP